MLTLTLIPKRKDTLETKLHEDLLPQIWRCRSSEHFLFRLMSHTCLLRKTPCYLMPIALVQGDSVNKYGAHNKIEANILSIL